MLTGKLYARGLSRLMSVLFAVQIVVGGFCLLTADAHATPQPMQTQNVHAHCVKSSHADDQHSQGDSGNCYHCDQPDQLSNSVFSAGTPIALAHSDVIGSPPAPLFSSKATGLFSIRTPTGPPRSSSLLYTITQRIRV